jgi:FMN phosphatase YigB (HAD superfamily)
MHPPHTVVFDLGGVVVRICRSWQEACARAGVPYQPSIMDPQQLVARKALVRQYELDEIDSQTFFDRISLSMGRVFTPEQIQRIHDLWIIEEYAGIAEVIFRLHERGINTGVLSNTNAWHWRQLAPGPHGPAKFPTASLPKHVHASHQLKLVKPELAIYQAFAHRVGVSASEVSGIVFFDDLPDNVAGARAAGWRAMQIDHAGDPAGQIVDHLRAMGLEL